MLGISVEARKLSFYIGSLKVKVVLACQEVLE
jgi:hypothetical protein